MTIDLTYLHSCVHFQSNGLKIYRNNVLYLVSDAFAKLRKATDRFVMSVCLCPSVRLSLWSNPAPTRRIIMKFDM
jgi:hypothetical protein